MTDAGLDRRSSGSRARAALELGIATFKFVRAVNDGDRSVSLGYLISAAGS